MIAKCKLSLCLEIYNCNDDFHLKYDDKGPYLCGIVLVINKEVTDHIKLDSRVYIELEEGVREINIMTSMCSHNH